MLELILSPSVYFELLGIHWEESVYGAREKYCFDAVKNGCGMGSAEGRTPIEGTITAEVDEPH